MNPELLKAFNSFIDEESENNPSLILDSYDGKIDIEWEDDSPVTPYGNLSFFIEYLNPDPSLALKSLMTVIRNQPFILKYSSYVFAS